jgi:hypothetical protein
MFGTSWSADRGSPHVLVESHPLTTRADKVSPGSKQRGVLTIGGVCQEGVRMARPKTGRPATWWWHLADPAPYCGATSPVRYWSPW